MTSSNEVKAALEDLGKFTIQEEVDEGANAVAAFKAFDRLLHRDAFLKAIYYSADAAAELLHEPRILVQATARASYARQHIQGLTGGGPPCCPLNGPCRSKTWVVRVNPLVPHLDASR